MPSRSDAEDILQETSLTICEKFSDFKEGTNFYSWACQIAYWKVRAARKKYATSKVLFNDEVLEGNFADPHRNGRGIGSSSWCVIKMSPKIK